MSDDKQIASRLKGFLLRREVIITAVIVALLTFLLITRGVPMILTIFIDFAIFAIVTLSLNLEVGYTGISQFGRVLAVMAGLIGMVDAAFEHKDDFYVLDGLDEQKLYNCARNVEIAVWKMSSTRVTNGNGQALLITNELDWNNPNLSFEREFGRIIGVLDLLSKIVADKRGRSVTRLTQSIATAVFLPVGALGLK